MIICMWNTIVIISCSVHLMLFVDLAVFFFKQKTAYEMSASLVGSEMCIRDRTTRVSNDYLCSAFPVTSTRPMGCSHP